MTSSSSRMMHQKMRRSNFTRSFHSRHAQDGIYTLWISLVVSKTWRFFSDQLPHNINSGNLDELSTCYKNRWVEGHDYAFASPTQQTKTKKGTRFGTHNAANYRDNKVKLKSLLLAAQPRL